MKKYLIALLAILILFVGCENGLRTGTLTINVGETTAKTVMPDKTKTSIAKYVVQGFCGSNTFKQEFTSSSFSLTLEEGNWSIYINAYGSDDKLVAKSDSQTVQIVRYKDVNVTFLLKPIFNGTGTFSFKLGIPDDATAMNKVVCSLTSETQAEVNFEFDFTTEGTIDGDYKIFTKTLTIPAGSYNLKVETTNLLGDVYGIPINDSVIIQAEQETSFEHIWDLAFFPEDKITLLVWKHYEGSNLYIVPNIDNAEVYLALDDGVFTDITADLDSNKYKIDYKTFTACNFYVTEDSSKWTRGGKIKTYSTFYYGPSGGYVFYDCDADNTEDDPDGADNLKSDVCGWRFLEAAATDLTDNYRFGYYSNDRTASTGTNLIVGTDTTIGTGKANTTALVSAMGTLTYTSSTGTAKGTYAAKACDDYSITVGGVVYDDWFLPSGDELNMMHTNLCKNGLGSFSQYREASTSTTGNKCYYYYWSSSEKNENVALCFSFHAGNCVSENRGLAVASAVSGGKVVFSYYNVRPVRTF